MAYVKDDYGHTRGVGAVASMDAVSSARRRAADRAARELARRDALMAASTLGAVRQSMARESAITRAGMPARGIDLPGRGLPGRGKPPIGGGGTPSSGCAPGDQKSEFGCITKKIKVGTSSVNSYWTCPPNTTPYSDMWCLRSAPAGGGTKPGRGPGRFGAGGRLVKSPGSVIGEPKTGTDSTDSKGSTTTTGSKGSTTTTGSKGSTTIVGGGSGTSWSAPSRGPSAANVGPLEPLPETPSEDEPPPAMSPAGPKPKTQSNMLMYAVIGAAGLWLLTRKK